MGGGRVRFGLPFVFGVRLAGSVRDNRNPAWNIRANLSSYKGWDQTVDASVEVVPIRLLRGSLGGE